jgi:hypothetical protein
MSLPALRVLDVRGLQGHALNLCTLAGSGVRQSLEQLLLPTDVSMPELRCLGEFVSLRKLRVALPRADLSGVREAWLGLQERLEELELVAGPGGDFSGLQVLRNLRKLDVDARGPCNFRVLGELVELESLTVTSVTFSFDSVKGLRKLKNLNVTSLLVGGIQRLGFQPQLETLSISSQPERAGEFPE